MIGDIKYSDVLHPTFQMAVRDNMVLKLFIPTLKSSGRSDAPKKAAVPISQCYCTHLGAK